MEYSVKFNGRSVTLPKYTLHVESLCSDVIDKGKQYNDNEINAERLLNAELDFLKEIVGSDLCEQAFGTDIQQMDIHEVDALCCDVVSEYQRPAREKQQKEIEQQYAPVKKILSEKGVAAALNVAAKAH